MQANLMRSICNTDTKQVLRTPYFPSIYHVRHAYIFLYKSGHRLFSQSFCSRIILTAKISRSLSTKSASLFKSLPRSEASIVRQGDPSSKAFLAALTALSTSACGENRETFIINNWFCHQACWLLNVQGVLQDK